MINYGKQTIDKADLDEVTKTLESDFLTQGPQVEGFESDLNNFFGSKFTINSLLVSTEPMVEKFFIGILTLYFRNSYSKTLEEPKNINLLKSKLLFFKSFTINSGPTPAGSPIVIPISGFITIT